MSSRLPRHLTLLIGASLSLAAFFTQASTVTGTVSVLNLSAYAADITNMTYATGGTALSGSGVMFCDDAFNHFPVDGSTHTYTVVGFAAQVAHAGGAARGEDYINWVFDHYYTRIFQTAGGDTDYGGYGFNDALWEIRHDFDGSVDSLSTSLGHIQSMPTLNVPIYADIVDNLKTVAIAEGYRSARYTLNFLNDLDGSYQSMVLMTDRAAAAADAAAANAVPEPSSLALGVLGGLALWKSRRKSAAKKA